jgi:hypothetical protein
MHRSDPSDPTDPTDLTDPTDPTDARPYARVLAAFARAVAFAAALFGRHHVRRRRHRLGGRAGKLGLVGGTSAAGDQDDAGYEACE